MNQTTRVENWDACRESIEQSRSVENAFGGGFIYIVESQGLYKIGRTNNLKRRLKDFWTTLEPFGFSLVYQCECRDSISTERSLHKTFSASRVCGEWFRLSEDELAAAKFQICFESVISPMKNLEN